MLPATYKNLSSLDLFKFKMKNWYCSDSPCNICQIFVDFCFLTYIKMSNPTENLKEEIGKIIELELLENEINRINRIKVKRNKRNNKKRIKRTRNKKN